MIAAIGRTTWWHLPCFTHSLNLVVQTTIRNDDHLTHVQQKCKDTVSQFHRSVKSAEKQRDIQKQLSLPEHKLVQEVTTKWNSTYMYLMFQRIFEQKDVLTTALCLTDQNHLCLIDDKKSLISDSLSVLGTFLEPTVNILGNKYITTSLIIPLVNLQKAMISHNSIPLATKLLSELPHSFAPVEGAFITAVTTLLDPRFKKLPFSTAASSDHAVSRITNEVANLLTASTTTSESDEVSPSHADGLTTVASSSLWNSFDASVYDSTSHKRAQSQNTIEVRRFFEEPKIDRTRDPSQLWKQDEAWFPYLNQIACKYLCIPGSSLPSKRLFSNGGQLVFEIRSRLKPENIDKMVFLNQNL
ncbi:PREDICTED: zinc finger BED domain-containing protein 1-like [Amphimedon queenslandica]|uniref:HAT C-terminal dimerisation domain-containing protein n=1 Tax=Amphimedon queenslandica TaxID=400682 RepID=A0A1X7V2R7_AMPQE|nr:PREDICTED: zinc finger BED domain-containing protein 1-like [Amphimedon queenslandica]|eukprot:XP_011403457.1 PREDICTED: zinc finger BED domain-containing protein 1-like [Amphimedon queenslandica]